MSVEFWLAAPAVPVLLGFSALFSSLESAYFSLGRATLERLAESDDRRAKRVAALMSDPKGFLVAILVGNTAANTVAAALAALLAAATAPRLGVPVGAAVALEVAVLTAVVLFLGELTPKLWALKDAEKWALKTSGVALFLKRALSPVAVPVGWFATGLARFLGIERQRVLAMTEDEIRSLVQVGEEHGELESEERRMIHSIVEFGDTTAREVMIPRIDMVAVEKGVSLEELLQVIIRHGHSRIPVYEGNIDNIVGIVHSKDLLAVAQSSGAFDIAKVMRKVYFVPEEKPLDDLLREFQSTRTHMAIVVDEYGGTAGLVTLEDVIEEILGEIQDEYDQEQPMMRRLDDRTVLANALVPIYDLNRELGYELIAESDAYDTLGGFVYSQLEAIPHKGQEFVYQGYRFIVDEVSGRRITKVRVVKESGVYEDA